MLQAVRLDGPRRMIAEDLSDPSLLGTGEHGGRYRSRTAPRGPVRVSSPGRAHKEPEWATARGLVPPTRAIGPGVSLLERPSLLRLLTTAICFAGRVRHQESRLRDDEQRIPASGSSVAPHGVLVALSAALAAPQRRRFNRRETATGLHVVRVCHGPHGFGP